MYLTEIKFIDMNRSDLDDGRIPDLKKAVGILEHKLSEVKGKTDEASKQRENIKTAIETAKSELEAEEKEFSEKLKTWKKNGRFKFKKKVYVSYSDSATRPVDYLQWNRYAPHTDFKEMRDWEYKWGYEPVVANSDPYWPEGIRPDAENHFRYGDAILMRIPFLKYLLKRVEAIDRSERGLNDRLAKFKSDVERSGGEVPSEMIDEIVDKYGI